MEKIYFDHAATTPIDSEVAKIVLEYTAQKYGNPNSIHSFGREARKAVEEARESVASLLGADKSEIFFTSGGTESDNLALKGVALANRKKGNHIITTAIEHYAVLRSCEELEKQGFLVTYLPVDENAMVRIEDVKNAITDKTILISVMFANNEVGTIQPIKEIGQLAKEKDIYFHTDAVQAVGSCPIDVNEYHIDLLSLSGHKLYGPKGVGAVYIRKGIKIGALQDGGSQEHKLRAGTENVSGIVGLGKAAEIARREMVGRIAYVTTLRDKLIKGIQDKIPDSKLNGHDERRLPGNVNFCFSYIEGESLLLNLDLKGIAASTGSACASGSLDPSHVLLAMGLSHETAQGSLRLSLGCGNTEADVEYCLEILSQIVERLRSMSPLSATTNLLLNNPCNQYYNH
ncbi:cysteine desulfurase NifS [Pelosinus baikalensis]|uniref:Cysteine desulfurase IscS n=1 Tax=Pelosinus baikalensis TaxID=2892015 RepID=A0ABS8HWE4_9FIRM|nr:cysteine desulfurase NifS [Pelosinus baikalensis]MCC5466901.1 cysteine desulfurase NifS [Pelosinus baikalensis]